MQWWFFSDAGGVSSQWAAFFWTLYGGLALFSPCLAPIPESAPELFFPFPIGKSDFESWILSERRHSAIWRKGVQVAPQTVDPWLLKAPLGLRSPFFCGKPPIIASKGQFHGKRALPGVASRGQPFRRQIEFETPPMGGIGRGILPSRLSERQSPDLDSHALRDTIFCCLPDQHLWRASERSGPGRRNCGKPARGPRRGGGGRVVAGRGILKSQDHGVCRVEVACQLWHIEAFGVNPQLICKRRMC